jgi:hypothetical protein
MTMEQPLTDLASKRGSASSLLRGLLVLSSIIVATLFAAELLLRIIDVSGPITKRRRATNEHNRTISVRHSSLGLREQELSDIAPDRFLFLGDSFTYGDDAEADQRFSDLLQEALPQYGMVNAGVSGYGTDQQFLLMNRLTRSMWS